MKLKKLSAIEELSVKQKARELLPLLLDKEISIEDAVAVANNAAMLYFAMVGECKSPKEVLKVFGLDEIAELCERVKNEGQWDINESFEEETP